jgi:ubiquinone/menaquinone biosynthesis C-methylase UbiE
MAEDALWVGSMPEAYERWLVPAVFHPFAVDLARRVAPRAPRRVLELAAGTGVLTRDLVAAHEPGAVTATELNDAMVDLGRRQEPRRGRAGADAMDVPFGDAEFDLVACQFGVILPRVSQFARRLRRRPGCSRVIDQD